MGHVRSKVRIPTGTGEAQAVDVFNVCPITAAVVEVGGVGREKARFHGEADGFGGLQPYAAEFLAWAEFA